MKKLILLSFLFTTSIFAHEGNHDPVQPAFELDQKETTATLEVDPVDGPAPWTNLEFKNNPRAFQFAIVSDRTGGHRQGVFEEAMGKLNLLQPEFVMSVGDLIEGYTEDKEILNNEWNEFTGFVEKLDMPFFFLPGNHDITNPVMARVWKERFGKANYHFLYNNVLFLCLNSMDGNTHQILQPQVEWIKEVLAENQEVHWTFVFVHSPLWDYREGERKAMWDPIEEALENRKYTVFAGHFHSYVKITRNDHRYFTLATTGGGSPLRGPSFGEFDHVAWVTMTDSGPIIANLMLDGIWDENVRTEDIRTSMDGFVSNGIYYPDPVLLTSPKFERVTKEIILRNDMDVPTHYTAKFIPKEDIQLEGEENISLTIPPNSVHSISLTLNTPSEIVRDNLKLLEIEWSANAQLPNDIIDLKGTSALYAVQTHQIKPTKIEFILDGLIHEWPELPFKVTQPKQILKDPEGWKGEDDSRYHFAVTYDTDYFYCAIEVIDDEMVAIPGIAPWEQDGIELRLDARKPRERNVYNRSRDDIILVAISPGDFSKSSIPVHPGNNFPEGTKFVCLPNESGYTAEIAIPINTIKTIAGGDWKNIRLNVQIDDTDNDDLGTAQLNWQEDWRTTENIPGSGTFVK
jgi:hypothetical protein